MAVDGGEPEEAAEGEVVAKIKMYPLTPEEEGHRLKREAMENHILFLKNSPFFPGETAHHPTTVAAIKALEVDLGKIPKAPPPKVAPLQDQIVIVKYKMELEKARNHRAGQHQAKLDQWKAEEEAADANKASKLQDLELRRAAEEVVILKHREALAAAMVAARAREDESYAAFQLEDATELAAAEAAMAAAAPAAAATPPAAAAAPTAAAAAAANATPSAVTMAQAQHETAAATQRLQDSLLAAGVVMPQGVCLAAMMLHAFTASQVLANPPSPGPRSPRGNPAAPPAPS